MRPLAIVKAAREADFARARGHFAERCGNDLVLRLPAGRGVEVELRVAVAAIDEHGAEHTDRELPAAVEADVGGEPEVGAERAAGRPVLRVGPGRNRRRRVGAGRVDQRRRPVMPDPARIRQQPHGQPVGRHPARRGSDFDVVRRRARQVGDVAVARAHGHGEVERPDRQARVEIDGAGFDRAGGEDHGRTGLLTRVAQFVIDDAGRRRKEVTLRTRTDPDHGPVQGVLAEVGLLVEIKALDPRVAGLLRIKAAYPGIGIKAHRLGASGKTERILGRGQRVIGGVLGRAGERAQAAASQKYGRKVGP